MLAWVTNPASYTVNPFAIPMAFTAALVLGIGALVGLREDRSQVTLSFLLVALTITVWMAAFSFMYCATDPRLALWWAKVAYLGVPCIPAAIYHFTVAVLRLSPRYAYAVRLNWWMSALFVVAIVGTDRLITGLARYWWGYYPQYGVLSAPYLTFFFAVMILSLRHYWQAFRQATPGTAHYHRVRAFFIAFAIVYLGSVDYLAKFHIPLYPFGYVPVCAFVLMVGRIMWRYHLVDLTPAFAATEILETMHGAVVVVDLDDRIQLVNRATVKLLGYRDTDLLGQPMTLIATSPMPLRPSPEGLPRDAWVRDREMTWTHREGHPRDVSVSASVLSDRHQPVGIVYVAIDITDRKQEAAKLEVLNQTLIQRAAELVVANQELERFNQLAVGRESRMLELKREVNELAAALGKPPPYDLSFMTDGDESAGTGTAAGSRRLPQG